MKFPTLILTLVFPISQAWCQETPSIESPAISAEQNAAEANAENQSGKSEVILSDLAGPVAICIHPKSDAVFFAEQGKGRVCKVDVNNSVEVVNGFEVGQPKAIQFDSDNILLVAHVTTKGEQSKLMISIFEIGEKPCTLADAKVTQELKLPKAHSLKNHRLNLVKMNSRWFLTTSDSNPAIGFNITGKKVSDIRPLVSLHDPSKVTSSKACTAVAIVPREANEPPNSFRTLLVATPNESGSKIEFLDEFDGFSMALSDVALKIKDMQYSSTKHLFAIGQSVDGKKPMGLFKILKGIAPETNLNDSNTELAEQVVSGLDEEKLPSNSLLASRTELILEISNPEALVFDSKGILWVSSLDGDKTVLSRVTLLDPLKHLAQPAIKSPSPDIPIDSANENADSVPQAGNDESNEVDDEDQDSDG